jgi:hypothetical protein
VDPVSVDPVSVEPASVHALVRDTSILSGISIAGQHPAFTPRLATYPS